MIESEKPAAEAVPAYISSRLLMSSHPGPDPIAIGRPCVAAQLTDCSLPDTMMYVETLPGESGGGSSSPSAKLKCVLFHSVRPVLHMCRTASKVSCQSSSRRSWLMPYVENSCAS